MTTKPKLTDLAKRFIEAHRASKSNREVAEKMQMSTKRATDYASHLRLRGVNLERFQSGRKRVNLLP